MANIRAGKIQRYREQKELEKRLTDLREAVEQEHVDEEVRVRMGHYGMTGGSQVENGALWDDWGKSG